MEQLIAKLNEIDTALFCWINGHCSNIGDYVLWAVSQHWCWAVVIVLFYCLTTLRKEPRKWWLVLFAVGLCFLLSDRISVVCFKYTVCRLRPCHVLDGVNMFRTSCGGQYGFVSSHAANVAAVAMLFGLRYGHRRRWGWVVPLLAGVWALLVCYSRPYLGKHYPGDVVCGALLGLGIGALVYFLMSKFENYLIRKNSEKHKEETAR